jgi:hypothetical protein
MSNTIRIKRRSSSGAAGSPANLSPAELAYNENDNILYYGFGDTGGVASSIISIAGSGAFMTTGTTQTISAAKTFSNITITGGSISGITDLAVADGGTGASTAPDARTNLGAAASGANSDITSITGLTTALTVTQGGTGATTASSARTNLLPSYSGNSGKVVAVNGSGTDIEYVAASTGSVTSVSATVPTSILSVSGSPITTSGTLAFSLATQTANYVWSGPTTGAASTPTFRALVAADIPALSYLSTSGGTVSGSVIVTGNLEVQGTTTTISSTTLTVADKNIQLAFGSTTEGGANGGGITLAGLTDHTILYTSSGSTWDFSEHINLASGKAFKINGTTVLSATVLDGVIVDGGTF